MQGIAPESCTSLHYGQANRYILLFSRVNHLNHRSCQPAGKNPLSSCLPPQYIAGWIRFILDMAKPC